MLRGTVSERGTAVVLAVVVVATLAVVPAGGTTALERAGSGDETTAERGLDATAGDRSAAASATAAEFEVTDLQAPDEIRPGDTYTVSATVTNVGDAAGSITVSYSWDAVNVSQRRVTLAPDESVQVQFQVSTAEVERRTGDVEPGTYIHGVRKPGGTGAVQSVRVTPDIDFEVTSFEAPAEVPREGTYVVSATVANPGNASVTRRVEYQFDTHAIVGKEVTVAGGESESVAFEVGVETLESQGLVVEDGETYTHALVAEGGSRSGGEVRVTRGTTSDPSVLAVEEFDATPEVGPGESVTVEVGLRNVESATFEGTVEYRFAGTTVESERVRIAGGEMEGLSFVVTYADLESTAGPLSTGVYDHGVWVGGDGMRATEIRVEAPTTTATTTTTERTTATTERTTTTVASTTDDPTTTTTTERTTTAEPGDDEECRRGFFTKCATNTPNFLNQQFLTLVGIVLSVVGIVFEMINK